MESNPKALATFRSRSTPGTDSPRSHTPMELSEHPTLSARARFVMPARSLSVSRRNPSHVAKLCGEERSAVIHLQAIQTTPM